MRPTAKHWVSNPTGSILIRIQDYVPQTRHDYRQPRFINRHRVAKHALRAIPSRACRPLLDRGRSLSHLVLYISYSMGTVPNTLLVFPWSNNRHANRAGATRRARTSIYPSNIAIARRIMLSILCRTIGITPCRAGASSDIHLAARSNDLLVGGCRGRRTTVATQQTLCMADRMMSSMLEERARPVHLTVCQEKASKAKWRRSWLQCAPKIRQSG